MLAMFTAIAPPVRTCPSRMPIGQRDQRGDEHRDDRELHVLAEERGDRLVAVPLVVRR